MPISNYPNGFANGVTLQNVPVAVYGGDVYWVDSGEGSDNYKGTSKRPFATIDKAIGYATANNGDVIFVKPGHQENIADATTFQVDVAGLTIIGLGTGSDMPQFNFTDTAGSVEIDSANTILENLQFVADVSAVVVGINVDAANVTIRNCWFTFNATGDDFLRMIDTNGVADWTIEGCRFEAEATAGANEAIYVNSGSGGMIAHNRFFGDYAVAVIYNDSTAHTDLSIIENHIYNADTAAAQNGIDLNTACTGLIAKNSIGTLQATDVTTLLDPGSCLCVENYAVNAINEHGVIVPATASTT